MCGRLRVGQKNLHLASLWEERLHLPSTAYVYDWNMLPIGQQLWLMYLETFVKFPALQNPASYNLEQVMQQIKEMKAGRE